MWVELKMRFVSLALCVLRAAKAKAKAARNKYKLTLERGEMQSHTQTNTYWLVSTWVKVSPGHLERPSKSARGGKEWPGAGQIRRERKERETDSAWPAPNGGAEWGLTVSTNYTWEREREREQSEREGIPGKLRLGQVTTGPEFRPEAKARFLLPSASLSLSLFPGLCFCFVEFTSLLLSLLLFSSLHPLPLTSNESTVTHKLNKGLDKQGHRKK